MSYYYILLLCILYIVSSLSYCAEVDVNPLQQLHRAVEHKDPVPLEQLLADHQSYINLPLNPRDGFTLLHKAARHQRLLMIKLLIKYKALIDPLDSSGSTPLHLAFTPTTVEVSFSGGPVPNGRTTIRYLAKQNLQNVVYELVKNGADIYLENGEGKTPLELADPTLQAIMIDEYEDYSKPIRTTITETLHTCTISDLSDDICALIAQFTR